MGRLGHISIGYFSLPQARNWIKTNAPNAVIEVYGKHMMFHEHAEQFNSRIDQYMSALH